MIVSPVARPISVARQTLVQALRVGDLALVVVAAGVARVGEHAAAGEAQRVSLDDLLDELVALPDGRVATALHAVLRLFALAGRGRALGVDGLLRGLGIDDQLAKLIGIRRLLDKHEHGRRVRARATSSVEAAAITKHLLAHDREEVFVERERDLGAGLEEGAELVHLDREDLDRRLGDGP